MTIRPPAVAGSFYPADPARLAATVDRLLADAAPPPVPGRVKALVSPHAGYVYSGPFAARAFATVAPLVDFVTRVVVACPTHRVGVRGVALPGADAFATPLGAVPVDSDALAGLAGLPQVVTRPDVHADEHALEVQLPFLQRVLGPFALVPLAVGEVSPEQAAEVLDAVWGGPETLVVISSDLSHYLPHDRARARDAATLDRILRVEPPVGPDDACGVRPLNGLLTAAPRHRLRPTLLGAGNSGDTAGDRSRVVGYAAIAWHEEE